MNGAELSQLKERLLQETASGLRDSSTETAPTREWLRRAAGDAESLAWQTPFPLLLLPALFEEKVQEVRRYTERQARVSGRCPTRVLRRFP